MGSSETLKTLWRRRRLVVLGALIAALAALLSVYRVGLFPPSLESRTNVFSTASTQVLVDSPRSALADLASDLNPLKTRAGVFARFLATPAGYTMIAREAGVPLDAIEARGPYDTNLPVFQQEPTAERRSSQILGEGAVYRLRFENNPDLPIISVFTQAPTRDEAVDLAAAVPVALGSYIERLQTRQQTPRAQQVQIRQLGDATGGVVNRGANIQIAALVFIVVLVGWCMVLIPSGTIAQGWRKLGEPVTARPGNGNGAPPRDGARPPQRTRERAP